MDYPRIPNLRLGTSSWSSQDWVGVFYPPGTAPGDFISEYAKHFDTVEVDSTFYRTPSPAMVRNWVARTPAGFLVAAKFPQVITHEKVLVDCATELSEFLKTMDLLGDKLGPLLIQFPYFNKQAFPQPRDFLVRLSSFLEQLPSDRAFAVELRNKYWINDRLLDLLRARNICFGAYRSSLDDARRPASCKAGCCDRGFCLPQVAGRPQRDRGEDQALGQGHHRPNARDGDLDSHHPQLLKRGIRILGFFNNHYAGFAPGSIKLFHEVWERLRDGDG